MLWLIDLIVRWLTAQGWDGGVIANDDGTPWPHFPK
jgi:hypothetical protein